MSTISLRIPESLHKRIREVAEKENVSFNQLITIALAESTPALLTNEYLEECAKRSRRQKFTRALSKVKDIEPEERNRL